MYILAATGAAAKLITFYFIQHISTYVYCQQLQGAAAKLITFYCIQHIYTLFIYTVPPAATGAAAKLITFYFMQHISTYILPAATGSSS